eukprot:scaffold6877_cov119-Isochrysis_galbana.AAC.1
MAATLDEEVEGKARAEAETEAAADATAIEEAQAAAVAMAATLAEARAEEAEGKATAEAGAEAAADATAIEEAQAAAVAMAATLAEARAEEAEGKARAEAEANAAADAKAIKEAQAAVVAMAATLAEARAEEAGGKARAEADAEVAVDATAMGEAKAAAEAMAATVVEAQELAKVEAEAEAALDASAVEEAMAVAESMVEPEMVDEAMATAKAVAAAAIAAVVRVAEAEQDADPKAVAVDAALAARAEPSPGAELEPEEAIFLDDQAAALDAQVRLIENELERRLLARREHEPVPLGAMAAWGAPYTPHCEHSLDAPVALPARPTTSAGAGGRRPARPQSAAPTRRIPRPPSLVVGGPMLIQPTDDTAPPRPVSAGPRVKASHGRRGPLTLTGSAGWDGGDAPARRGLLRSVPDFVVRPFSAEQGPLSATANTLLPVPPPSNKKRMKQLTMIYGTPAAASPRSAGRLGGGSKPVSAGGREWHIPGSRQDAPAHGGRKHSLATEYIPMAWNGAGIERRDPPVVLRNAVPPSGLNFVSFPPSLESSATGSERRTTTARSAW